MRGITIDWSQIDWKWLFTTTLALYAAVVATYREVVSRGQWRPNLKVRLSVSIVLIGNGETVPQVQVWIENHGRCDLLFNSNSVSVAVKGQDTAWLIADPMSNVSFPHTLKPGGSFYFLKERAPLIEALRAKHPGETSVEMRASIFDAISRPFYSDWQDVSLTEETAD
jgi:hypothetical protein